MKVLQCLRKSRRKKKKSKQVENKQGTLLSWVKPCTSDPEPGVVEETIRIKEQPGNENDLEPSTTIAGKYALTVGPKRGGGGGLMWATRSAFSVILFLLRAWVGPSRRGSLRLNIVEIV